MFYTLLPHANNPIPIDCTTNLTNPLLHRRTTYLASLIPPTNRTTTLSRSNMIEPRDGFSAGFGAASSLALLSSSLDSPGLSPKAKMIQAITILAILGLSLLALVVYICCSCYTCRRDNKRFQRTCGQNNATEGWIKRSIAKMKKCLKREKVGGLEVYLSLNEFKRVRLMRDCVVETRNTYHSVGLSGGCRS